MSTRFLNTEYSLRVNKRHFWRENVIAVVILLRGFSENVVVAGTSYKL